MKMTLPPPQATEAPTLTATILQPEISRQSAPVLPPPRLNTVQATLVVPDIDIRLPPAPTAITVTNPNPAATQSAIVSLAPGTESAPTEISDVAYLRQPLPRYPPQSRQAHEEGRVLLRVLIDAQGHAAQVTVLQSSGHPRLDSAACEAVARAVFKPHLVGGVPREGLATIPVEFSLHRV